MTDVEFANIASIYEGITVASGATLTRAQADVLKLLTEVKRLQEERKDMLYVIEAAKQVVTSSQVDNFDSFTHRMRDLNSVLVWFRDLIGDDDE